MPNYLRRTAKLWRRLRLILQSSPYWAIKEWSKVLWSDENKFNLVSSDGIQYVRHSKNESMVPGTYCKTWWVFFAKGIDPLFRDNDSKHRSKVIEEYFAKRKINISQ
ncbi:hypothetical protein HZH68_012621 [Vespula germanica]|uniref:Transposase n=1 Tax=Vespula germanica TaxID=30212 RepID=A0A834JKH2_VESGE|nr:hypothetical protein HZH68_012621 [Vespula germanica]